MIVCFECKRAASKVLSIVLFLIYLFVHLGDLFTCTQQMHWGNCLTCAIWHLYAMIFSQMSSHLALPLSQQVHNLQILILNLQYLIITKYEESFSLLHD